VEKDLAPNCEFESHSKGSSELNRNYDEKITAFLKNTIIIYF